MNIDRKERIEMIKVMMMAITNIPEKRALELLESTITYQNILNGEECTLYESYSANLEDVVEELREYGKGEPVKRITEDSILRLNKWIYDNSIQNAEQLKRKKCRKQIAVSTVQVKGVAARRKAEENSQKQSIKL